MSMNDTRVSEVQQLTQAIITLTNFLQQTGSFAPGNASQINVWEDDPFSEAVATLNPVSPLPDVLSVPVNTVANLQTSTSGVAPAPARYTPGTADFRYWVAQEALTRGINFWGPLLPAGTMWSSATNPLTVTLVAGSDFNANYNRNFGLRFYAKAALIGGDQIYSGESPDVVCHELGHAILDAIRPELFHAMSVEVSAFHESFGDMSAILSALQSPSLRQKVLSETGGQLNVNSRLSRLAEQLGWAIRQSFPTAVETDCLRNASNQWVYQPPATLPFRAPASQLSSEVHSFSRIFTGAFYDALAGMLVIAGGPNDAALQMISQNMGQLLVDGALTAPILPNYFSQVAVAMLQADHVRFKSKYRNALGQAFARHGILSPSALATLHNAPVPKLDATSLSISGNVGNKGQILFYDSPDENVSGYAQGFGETPELPGVIIKGWLPIACLVHMALDESRFPTQAIAADAGGVSPASEPEYAGDAAFSYLEDLFQLGKVDFGNTMDETGVLALLTTPLSEEHKTHEAIRDDDVWIIRRRHFDCGFCCSR